MRSIQIVIHNNVRTYEIIKLHRRRRPRLQLYLDHFRRRETIITNTALLPNVNNISCSSIIIIIAILLLPFTIVDRIYPSIHHRQYRKFTKRRVFLHHRLFNNPIVTNIWTALKLERKKKKNAEERKFKKKETKVFKALSANWNDLKDFDTRTKKIRNIKRTHRF